MFIDVHQLSWGVSLASLAAWLMAHVGSWSRDVVQRIIPGAEPVFVNVTIVSVWASTRASAKRTQVTSWNGVRDGLTAEKKEGGE